jgi:hypothetical protein
MRGCRQREPIERRHTWGCIVEVLGIVAASAQGWDVLPPIALAVVLAFIFGYALAMGSDPIRQ